MNGKGSKNYKLELLLEFGELGSIIRILSAYLLTPPAYSSDQYNAIEFLMYLYEMESKGYTQNGPNIKPDNVSLSVWLQRHSVKEEHRIADFISEIWKEDLEEE